MTPEACEAAIRDALPGFSFASVELVREQGWAYWTFEVDGEWIFRFPRTETDARLLEREFAVLPALAARMPLQVPRYQYRGTWNGMPFGGYRRIEGRRLEPGALTVPAIARQVGEAVAALHGFPVEMAQARLGEAAPGEAWEQRQTAFRVECRERVYPLLPEPAREGADRLFADFDALVAKPATGLALVHNDLGLEHILGEGDRLTGIIDWSDMAIGDPAVDFAGMLREAGAEGVQRVMRFYGRPTGERFLERVRYYKAVAPFYDVVYGLTSGNEEAREAGLAALVREFGG